MRDVASIIDDLRRSNIRLTLNNDNIEVESFEGKLSDEVLQEIRQNKEYLVAYFKNNFNHDSYDQIKPAKAAANYPLSSAQRRLWLLSQFQGSQIAYHISGQHLFEGILYVEALKFAFKVLIERHEILRSVFKEDEKDEVRQFVHSTLESKFELEVLDLRGSESVQRDLEQHLQRNYIEPFNLKTGAAFRANLYQIGENKWVFGYVMHHIIGDGWSIGILVNEVLLLYNAYVNGHDNPLRPMKLQYKDYAVWQQEQLQSGALEDHKAYWIKQFSGALPILGLPADHVRPLRKTYNGDAISQYFDPHVSKEFKALISREGHTLFMGLLAVVKALMYRYTGQEDIIIGTSIASREHSIIENSIGFYVNTLPLRTKLNVEDSFRDLLVKTRNTTLGAYAHQAYPFDELLDALELKRDVSRHPLFDVMVVMKNMTELKSLQDSQSAQRKNLRGLLVGDYEGEGKVFSKFDLTFFFAEDGDGVHLRLVYNPDVFLKSTAERMMQHLSELLKCIITMPEVSIGKIKILPDFEKDLLLRAFNKNANVEPPKQTIVEHFHNRAAISPDSIALVCGEKSITYRELDQKSNQLANYLIRQCGVPRASFVGIMLDRSVNMIIAMIAIMKAGSAYVAIDPEIPTLRKQFIISDTSVAVLVTQAEYILELDYYDGSVFAIDVQLDLLTEPTEAQRAYPDLSDLAYVTYTSGSTGQPKGVMISHLALTDYYYGIVSSTNIAQCRKLGLVSTIAADLGNTVIFPSLLLGAALYILTTAESMDYDKISQLCLDVLKIVPSHWKALQVGRPPLLPNKCIVFGGEPLGRDVVEMIAAVRPTCEVYNHYGPSETTIGKLIKRISLESPIQKVMLGAPFGRTSVHITDRHGELVPIGVVGEICIAGDGLARGYLKQPLLTAERFVDNPFAPGTKMYRTGDFGRWSAEGEVEFVGRKDDQVKIRGYRVELGEVAIALQSHPKIEAATVLVKTGSDGDKQLIAFIVTAELLAKSEIQRHLASTLPAYMQPGEYVVINEMPLTPNGKIDRERLLTLEQNSLYSEVQYVSPRNEIEMKLVTIWQEVLGKRKVGVVDNFFDLGGHSINAVQLISRINLAFSVRISIDSIFEEGTIEGIGEQIAFILMQHKNDSERIKTIQI